MSLNTRHEEMKRAILCLVDDIADSEHVEAFLAKFAPVFLHESNNERPQVFVVIFVRVGHGDAVLRIRPERVCTPKQTH